MAKNYKVLKVLPIEVLNELKHDKTGHTDTTIDDVNFFYFPQKVKTFAKNTKCICCGVEGTEIRIERMDCYGMYSKPHLNMYAKYGMYEVLMTVDHNVLASKGGADLESNFNTMCSNCNQLRSNKYDSAEAFLEAVKGRDLLQEYMVKFFNPRSEKAISDAEDIERARLQQKFWESDHLWHYREYLRVLKKEEKKRKREEKKRLQKMEF